MNSRIVKAATINFLIGYLDFLSLSGFSLFALTVLFDKVNILAVYLDVLLLERGRFPELSIWGEREVFRPQGIFMPELTAGS
jgi:hypothetical protein